MSRGRNRAREADASNEVVELEAAETLLSRLKKQYRMMERNRRQYYDETKVFVTKQRKMVADLEEEKNRLEENLSISSARRNRIRDIKVRNTMSAILNRQEYYEKLIDNEKDKIKDLDYTITSLEKQLRHARRKVPSTRLLDSERESAKVANVALENRIQQGTVRLNAILAENTILRLDIENQLKERDKFVLQARRLEKLLAATCKKKSDLMDQVTKAYTEREEAQTKMRTLRERIERDNLKYSNEMKKIQRAIDYQSHLKSFVNTISPGDEEELFRRRQEGEGLDEGTLETTIENYRYSITHLEETIGETSIDNLLSNYLQADNDNYTLFSYISDLNNEVTALTAEVRRLQQEIDEVQGKGSKTEKDNCNTLGNLREELSHLREKVAMLEGDLKKADVTTTEVIKTTTELFSVVHCDSRPVQALIGEIEVTRGNLSVFLSVIEQKVKELSLTRDILIEEGLPLDMRRTSNDHGNESSPESSMSTATKAKPTVPHIGHMNEDDTLGPTTHCDLMSTLRAHFSDNNDN